jgi:hypothetical protein
LKLAEPLYLVRLGVARRQFADAEYIYPVGFTTRITFWSVRECGVELERESVVGDGWAAPVFRINAVDDPEMAFEGAIPMRCGTPSQSQGRTLFESVRTPGMDMFWTRRAHRH